MVEGSEDKLEIINFLPSLGMTSCMLRYVVELEMKMIVHNNNYYVLFLIVHVELNWTVYFIPRKRTKKLDQFCSLYTWFFKEKEKLKILNCTRQKFEHRPHQICTSWNSSIHLFFSDSLKLYSILITYIRYPTVPFQLRIS